MNIKFENGSEIQSITSDNIKRGRQSLLLLYEDIYSRLKWYQRLRIRICSWFVEHVDGKIRPWKYYK